MTKSVSKTRSEIRIGLIEQLRLRKADVPVFVNLVDDYLSLWDTKEDLIKNIKEHGVYVEGATGMKENPCVKQQVSVNAQMLKILTQLNITTDNIVSDVDDEL